MAKRNTYHSYGSISKFFHWTVFILVFVMVVYGFLLSDIPKAWQGFAYNTHKLTGLTILLLMILRSVWALKNPKPKLPSKTPLWQIAAERLMHFSFYLVLLAMPIAGWVMSSAAGRPPKLFGYALSLPITQSKSLAKQASNIHEFLAFLIIAMVCIHVLAALKHYFINKDNVFQRMLPFTSK